MDEVSSYAEKINVIFKETSAKDDFGITELFEEIGNKILSYDNFKDTIYKRNRTFLTDATTEEDENTRRLGTIEEIEMEKNKRNKAKDKCC